MNAMVGAMSVFLRKLAGGWSKLNRTAARLYFLMPAPLDERVIWPYFDSGPDPSRGVICRFYLRALRNYYPFAKHNGLAHNPRTSERSATRGSADQRKEPRVRRKKASQSYGCGPAQLPRGEARPDSRGIDRPHEETVLIVTATVTVWGAPTRSPHIAQIAASSFDARQVAADHSVSRNESSHGCYDSRSWTPGYPWSAHPFTIKRLGQIDTRGDRARPRFNRPDRARPTSTKRPTCFYQSAVFDLQDNPFRRSASGIDSND